eukprot:728986-Prymnesium_polylepis.1
MTQCGNASGALYIAKHSHCPGEAWHDEVSHLLDGSRGLTFVNVGANKGYNLAAFMQRYASRSQDAPSFRHWHALLQRNDSGQACQSQCCG